MVEILLEGGAEIEALNGEGKRPRDFCFLDDTHHINDMTSRVEGEEVEEGRDEVEEEREEVEQRREAIEEEGVGDGGRRGDRFEEEEEGGTRHNELTQNAQNEQRGESLNPNGGNLHTATATAGAATATAVATTATTVATTATTTSPIQRRQIECLRIFHLYETRPKKLSSLCRNVLLRNLDCNLMRRLNKWRNGNGRSGGDGGGGGDGGEGGENGDETREQAATVGGEAKTKEMGKELVNEFPPGLVDFLLLRR